MSDRKNDVAPAAVMMAEEKTPPVVLPVQLSRRDFIRSSTLAAAGMALPLCATEAQTRAAPAVSNPAPASAASTSTMEPARLPVTLVVNGLTHQLTVEPRVTLLDALRELIGLTGTKKGCDRGQCGACTVLVSGRRINACLTLAVMHEGQPITTIEGLAAPRALHPMQAAFIEHDAFQCGYCTPGQICSAVAALGEMRAQAPSAATPDIRAGKIEITAAEVRERMSGNICRCGAYPNIVAAVIDVAHRQAKGDT